MTNTYAARDVPNPCAEGLLCALQSAYILAMLRRDFVIPPKAAQAFVSDMRAFFKAKGQFKQDEIAGDTAWMLKQHLPKGTKLRISEVKEQFKQMKDHA